MKKITLLLLTAIVTSCGYDPQEQMLHDYQQNNVGALNLNLDDLDFRIHKVEKVSDITAADSLIYLKKELAKVWTKNPGQSLTDTLSFDFMKKTLNRSIVQLDTLIGIYHRSAMLDIKQGIYSSQLLTDRKIDEAAKEKIGYSNDLISVESLEKRYIELNNDPKAILSTKYKAAYSFKNPMLGNIEQTFNEFYYTNRTQDIFVKKEAR